MLKSKAQDLRRAILTASEGLSDDVAIGVPELFSMWSDGAEYAAGTRVRYEGTLYKVLTDHTSQTDWTPDTASSLYARLLTDPAGGVLDWVQPDSTNPYMTGDRVLYEGKVYESLVDNNVWSPADYPAGWMEVAT